MVQKGQHRSHWPGRTPGYSACGQLGVVLADDPEDVTCPECPEPEDHVPNYEDDSFSFIITETP